ncbi:MAG: hypothetical protein LUO98_03520 [Methanoregula sp.]|nr:hypothetical protein [Methanoregula sp.]
MRRLMCVLVVLFLCILAISAGCTGIPGMPKAAAPGSASVPVTEPTGKAGNSWTGTFMTTWQGGGHDVRMVLVQSGSAVTGTYEYSDGTIIGAVTGNRLIGTWTEDNGASKGPFEFEMAGDGKTFAGWWDYEGADFEQTKKDEPSWTGIRVT